MFGVIAPVSMDPKAVTIRRRFALGFSIAWPGITCWFHTTIVLTATQQNLKLWQFRTHKCKTKHTTAIQTKTCCATSLASIHNKVKHKISRINTFEHINAFKKLQTQPTEMSNCVEGALLPKPQTQTITHNWAIVSKTENWVLKRKHHARGAATQHGSIWASIWKHHFNLKENNAPLSHQWP